MVSHSCALMSEELWWAHHIICSLLVKLARLSRGDCHGVVCYAAYFFWALDSNIFDIPSNFFTKDVLAYGILLPLLHRGSNIESCYYLITSEWQEMASSGRIGRPRLPGGEYWVVFTYPGFNGGEAQSLYALITDYIFKTEWFLSLEWSDFPGNSFPLVFARWILGCSIQESKIPAIIA